LLEKAAGNEGVFIPGRTGLADEVGSDAIPDAAGGEGGHGAAKPDGVIHRYVFYQTVAFRHHLILASSILRVVVDTVSDLVKEQRGDRQMPVAGLPMTPLHVAI
jgi:hypothetical protein